MALTRFPVAFQSAPSTTPAAIIEAMDGTVWNGSALAAYASGSYATYPINLTQLGSGRLWYLTVPATLAAGTYSVTVTVPAVSSTPVEATDQIVGSDIMEWDGTDLVGVVSRLAPTTAGRTLDVTATGGAGIDWANVENPTTSLNLSGTTVATVTNQLTAAAIATGVWQDATAGDFTAASSIGKCLYVGNVAPGDAGGHFIAGTNAATTITTALTTTFTGNLTGSVGSVSGAVGSVVGAVGSVTGNVGGSVASVVGLTASNLDATVSSRLAPTVAARTLDVSATGGAGIDWSNVENPTTTLDLSGTTIATVSGGATAAQIATAVWQDATAGDFTVVGSIGKSLYTAGVVPGGAGGLFVAGTNAATTVTTAFTSTFTGSLTGSVASVVGAVGSVSGSVGSVVGLTASNLDAAVSSRMATYSQPAGFLAATFPATVGSSTLTQTQVTGGAYTVQSSSCVLGDARIANLDATVSSRLPTSSYTAAPTAGQNAAATLAAGDVDGFTLEETLKLCLSVLAGKLSGAGTSTVTLRSADDTVSRVVATIAANNRTAVVLNAAG